LIEILRLFAPFQAALASTTWTALVVATATAPTLNALVTLDGEALDANVLTVQVSANGLILLPFVEM